MMKGKFTIAIVLLAILDICCVRNSSVENVPIVELKGKRISVDSDFPRLFRPFQINEYFFSNLVGVDTLGYMAEFRNDSLLSKVLFLPKGNGPMEYNNISMGNEGDSLLVILNCMGSTPSSFDFYQIDSLSNQDCMNQRRVSLDMESLTNFRGGYSSFVVLSDSTILMNSGGFDSGSVFSILNINTSELYELDWLPGDGFVGNCFVKQGIYVDNSYMYKNGDDIFYLCGNGMYAFIFYIDNGKLIQKRVIYDRYPEYKAMQDDINYKMKATNILKACADRNGIYILELDLDRDKNPVNDDQSLRWYGNIIHYYDWNGVKIVDYKVDTTLSDITMDSENNILYGIQYDGGIDDDILYKFVIP